MDEYKADIRNNFQKSNEQQAMSNLQSAAWQKVVESSEIKEVPEVARKFAEKIYNQQFKAVLGQSGLDLDAYLEQRGVSKEDYEKQKENYITNTGGQILIMNLIAKKEGFKVGDEGYNEILQGYLTDSGLTE